ncbi:MAG TPA: hypothetical protein VIK51_13000 [Vicinamibacteria bacterium]|jgi:hypothetical protein
MIGASVAACHYLTLALLVPAPVMERQEARGARFSASFGHASLGMVRLEFLTLAPGANTDGIKGTVGHDPGEPWVVHRILMDTARGLYYGYDIELSKGDGPGRFVVAIKPLAPAVEQEFRQSRWSDFCRDCQAPQPMSSSSQRFPEPRTVSAGDTLAIDLLADERSGELITDRVTFAVPRRAQVPAPIPSPRDLKAEVVDLQMAQPRLLVNGKPAWEDSVEGRADNGGGSVQGDVIWTGIPGRGRVFLSLAPRTGYDFKKSGVVAGNRISFTIEGDRYEWISQGPVATAGPVPPFNNVQNWYVWVLHDAEYRPAAGPNSVGAGFDQRAENRLKRR